MNHKSQGKNLIQLEISSEKLAFLFESGLICAAEIRCLSADSKQQVSALCLTSCAKSLACNITLFNEFSETLPIHLKKLL